MARSAILPHGNESSPLPKILSEGKISELLGDGGTGEAIARMDAALLFDPYGPRGRYTPEDLRERKLRYGRTVARVAPELLTEGIGDNLREARERARLTREESAKALGFSTSTLRRIESGEKRADIGTVISMCTLYACRFDRIVGIIDKDEERLIDLYEASSPSVRANILEAAELFNGGKVREGDADNDFIRHLQGIIDSPDASRPVRDMAEGMLSKTEQRLNE